MTKATSKSIYNATKRPSVINISPEFEIPYNECVRRRITPVLSGLKVKDWTNIVAVVEKALENETSLVSSEAISRKIYNFFTNVQTSYAENVALSKYSKACKEYLMLPRNKTEVQNLILTSLKLKKEKSKQIVDTTYKLRSKIGDQIRLSEAAKDYQAAKFEADALLNALGEQNELTTSVASTSSLPSTSAASTAAASSTSPASPTLSAPAPTGLNIDNVFTFENQSESIGQRIKKEAIDLHDIYIQGGAMSAEAELVMDMGLSSILDLTHKDDNYQAYLFSKTELKSLTSYFYNKFTLNTSITTPAIASENWKMIVSLATKKGPFLALKYISKIQSLESTSEVLYAYLEIFKHVVNVFYEDYNMIDGIVAGNIAVSEQDVYDIWFPIIKKLVLIRKITRMKKGETTNSFTSKRKRSQYFNQDKIKGFKIDVRLLLDYETNEIDLCSGEFAIDANDKDKLIHDRSKCLREAKEILDHHIEAGMGERSVGWTIQFAGLEARLMSVHLFKEGLYVAISQKKMKFPQSLGELDEFTDALNGLEQLVASNESEAVELIGLFNRVSREYSSALNNYNYASNESLGLSSLTKPTYYTPPSGRKAESVIPPDIYTCSRRRLFTEKIIIGGSNPEVPAVEKKGSEDLFGWCELTNGNWYNSVTGVTTETHPYQ